MSAQSEVVSLADVWTAFMDPVVGHEQGGRRPVVVVSVDGLHSIPSSLVFVVPTTTRNRGVASHVRVRLRSGSLPRESFAMTEQIRAVSTLRLRKKHGSVDLQTLEEIRERLLAFLGIEFDVHHL